MTENRWPGALMVLRVVLGSVILLEAGYFALSPLAARAFAATGLPNPVRLTLAWLEVAAAILFLFPRTKIFGGWSLIVVLVLAIAVHLLHGWVDVGGLAVYVAAAWAVVADTRREGDGEHGRL